MRRTPTASRTSRRFIPARTPAGVAQFRLAAESPDSAKTNYVLGVRDHAVPERPVHVRHRRAQLRNPVPRDRPGGRAAPTRSCTSIRPAAISARRRRTRRIPSAGASPWVRWRSRNWIAARSPARAARSASSSSLTTSGRCTWICSVPRRRRPALPPVRPTGGAVDRDLYGHVHGSPHELGRGHFGDGGTTNLTDQHRLYTYTTAGIYTVTLIASNAGGSSTDTQTKLITVRRRRLRWPVSSGSPTSGTEPLTVSLHRHVDGIASRAGTGILATPAPPT